MRWLIAALSRTAALLAVTVAGGSAALAEAPEPWQLGLQEPVTPIMERVESFHDLLLWIIVLVSVFVLGLLLYACFRFRESRNPAPSRRSHNTLIEVIWTAVPVLILVIIAIPSFKLLYFMDVVPETEMTLKATGRQWYWSYEYPDNGQFTFDAYMLEAEELEGGQLRLLETDNRVVLPTETNIRVQVTSSDVLHSWAMPSMGIKIDAVPGRLNEVWIRIEEPGTYYGQCSELCGVRHGFMPITIEALPRDAFDAWVEEAQATYARIDREPLSVAASR